MPDVIGRAMDRVDAELKVTGRATYTADHKIPNVAHGVLVVSPIAKGHITSVDTSAAEHVPGILAVLTHLHPPKVAKSPAEVEAGSPADRALQLLQDNRILYAGQPVAVVVAETLHAGFEAANLVHLSYAVDPCSVVLDRRMANAFVPEKAGGGGDPGESSRGDIAAGLEQADVRLEQVYRTPFQTHNPMEPHNTLAVWEGPDKLTVYDATQGIFGDRKRIAELLGLQVENVRVISLYLGGGFGSKGPTWSHVLLCALAARQVNRPVKLVVKRPQMFGSIGCRSETRQAIRIGAKRNGSLTALSNETYTHTSSFDQFVETATLPSRMLYSVPNNYTVQRVVRSDITTPSYMRAPGEMPGTLALEIALDELAYELNMDPVQLRLKNYADTDEEKNLPWSSKSLRECYQRGAERFGWTRRPMRPRSMREGHELVGWGMGTSVYPTRRNEAGARARLNADGSLLVESGSQDLGTGTYTVMTQVAADGLGLPVSQVTFRLGDTNYPQTPVSGGSQTAASTGSAVYLATRALRDKVTRLAINDPKSPVHGANLADVVVENGRIFRRAAASQGETLAQLVARSGQPYIDAEADAKPGEEAHQYGMYAFGAQFAEVRVDEDLGQMRVSRMVAVFAAGRILNAKTARSQFIGGMVWGISTALYEHSTYDERFGRIINNNLAEYYVPTNADIGSLEAYWVDEVDPHVGPIGVKGIGEIGITGSAAAVANAVYHATGKRVREMPITLDKLL